MPTLWHTGAIHPLARATLGGPNLGRPCGRPRAASPWRCIPWHSWAWAWQRLAKPEPGLDMAGLCCALAFPTVALARMARFPLGRLCTPQPPQCDALLPPSGPMVCSARPTLAKPPHGRVAPRIGSPRLRRPAPGPAV